ncbi:unnamed protein product [Amoebophrya sp. A120]|nr:unnamed protein product [Amoebophrya sp. A120]|eukprot:GSA120T00016469001.1
MASLKAISMRMKSVANIGKITSAMKMVSTAKFKHDERRYNAGKPFSDPVVKFYEKLPPMDSSSLPALKMVVLSSDKGMCGGINSGLAKSVRVKAIEEEQAGTAVELMCCGSKAQAALKRNLGNRFSSSSFEEIQAVPFNFTTASMLAESAMAGEPARINVVHNHFQSMIAYEPLNVPVYTKKAVKNVAPPEWSKAVDQYNFEPPTWEVWDDLQEFYTACAIYGKYLDGIISEQSARMAAMDNASKNSDEIVDKLTLQYNRGRQARITTELCEIIAGASAQ